MYIVDKFTLLPGIFYNAVLYIVAGHCVVCVPFVVGFKSFNIHMYVKKKKNDALQMCDK